LEREGATKRHGRADVTVPAEIRLQYTLAAIAMTSSKTHPWRDRCTYASS
jgi:hypothetical protein